MSLVVVLFSLGLDRFFNLGRYIQRFNWYDNYLAFCQPMLAKMEAMPSFLKLAVLILPIPILVGLLYLLFSAVFAGIVGIVLAIFVLFYCFGPEELHEQVAAYATASDSFNLEEMDQIGERLIVTATSDEDKHSSRSITESLFIQANERYFAVIFWFIILGPFGALLYRMISLLSQNKNHELAPISEVFLQLLDWVPARLVTFSFLLVGHFTAGISHWIRLCVDGLEGNDELLMNCGLAASGYDVEDVTEMGTGDISKAMGLIDRALCVWLVVIALVILGGWFL